MKEKALEVLKEYNKSIALVRHGIGVGGVMGYFAEEAGENVDYWTAVGILHDIDYEMFPEEHCKKATELLKDAGYDDDFIHAVVSHGFCLVVDVEPQLYMEKVLYTIDELTGLIGAAALMRPSKSVMDIEVKSVKKKFKDKAFAASINRGVILDGCKRLDLELDVIIDKCIKGMRSVATDIGL